MLNLNIFEIVDFYSVDFYSPLLDIQSIIVFVFD